MGVRGAAKMECLVENVLKMFLIVSGSCLVSGQLLSSAATAATKVVGHCNHQMTIVTLLTQQLY